MRRSIKFVAAYLAAGEGQGATITYVSFNRSPQTISRAWGREVSQGAFQLIDCFSSGKGNNDTVFLDFYESGGEGSRSSVVHVGNPSDPAELERALTNTGAAGRGTNARYVFDSLTGMLDLWGDEDVVLRFFGHICPRLFDLSTIAYWFLETEAHSQRFLAKVRHITQVVLEIGISRGIRTLTLRKAANRRSTAIGVPQWFRVVEGKLAIAAESREDRELSLLTRMGEALGTALVPNSFFEETMNVLASELGMIRGTVVLLDRTTGQAAHRGGPRAVELPSGRGASTTSARASRAMSSRPDCPRSCRISPRTRGS